MKTKINHYFQYWQRHLAQAFRVITGDGKVCYRFGAFIVISFTIYNIFLQHNYTDTNAAQIISIIATWLGIFLVVNKYWPIKLKPFLPFYWYFTILFCLPFSNTFIFLTVQQSPLWFMNTVTALFVLALLVEWIPFLIILVIGIVTALLVFYLCYGYILTNPIKLEAIVYYVPIIFAGLFFITKRNQIQNAKVDIAKMLGSNLAHDLRTPLASIRLAAQATSHYIPALFHAYNLAKDAELPVQNIQKQKLELAESSLQRIINEVSAANDIISKIEINLSSEYINRNQFKILSIKATLNKSLESFPYRSETHQSKIKKLFVGEEDFQFLGCEQLTMYIIFNLLSNAFHYINIEGEGEVLINIKCSKTYNELHFQDTARSIPDEVMPYIFNYFFSDKRDALGMGLTFCRNVMRAYGGDIIYRKNADASNEFILFFPAIEHSL